MAIRQASNAQPVGEIVLVPSRTQGPIDASSDAAASLPESIAARHLEAVTLGWMGARRFLARVICSGPTR